MKYKVTTKRLVIQTATVMIEATSQEEANAKVDNVTNVDLQASMTTLTGSERAIIMSQIGSTWRYTGSGTWSTDMKDTYERPIILSAAESKSAGGKHSAEGGARGNAAN